MSATRTKALLRDLKKTQPVALGHSVSLGSNSDPVTVVIGVLGLLAVGGKFSLRRDGTSIEKWEMHVDESGTAEHQVQASPANLRGTELRANLLVCSLHAQTDTGDIKVSLRQGSQELPCEPPIVFRPIAVSQCKSNKARRLPTIQVTIV